MLFPLKIFSKSIFSSQFTNLSHILLSQKPLPISPTTRNKVGVQSHAKSPSKPKNHRCSTKQTYLGPSGFLHLGEQLSNNYNTGNYKGDRQNSLSQHSVLPLSLFLFLSSISPCNELAIILAETTSINICG